MKDFTLFTMVKTEWHCPGSNWGPSACEADVITTTLQCPHVYSFLHLMVLLWVTLRGQTESDVIQNTFMCFSWWKSSQKRFEKQKHLTLPRLELGTFCVLDRCDNHYTTVSCIFVPSFYLLFTPTNSTLVYLQSKNILTLPRLELGTFCV